MTKKVSYVTKEGLKKLQDELANLQNVERPKISKAIGEAIEKGDISENAEYDACLLYTSSEFYFADTGGRECFPVRREREIEDY